MLQFMGLQSVEHALVRNNNKESELTGEAVDSDTMKDHVEVLVTRPLCPPFLCL